jgi:hypothetical protein
VTEKFSYYDLLAYLVPGTVVLWAAIQLTEAVGILRFIETDSTLLDASTFVVVAFLAGHLIQAEAQRRLDSSHRYSVFPEGFPSRFFLVRDQNDEEGRPWCSDARRLEYIAAACRHGFLSGGQADILRGAVDGKDKLERAMRTSQEAYRAAFSYLTDIGRAQKAITANQTYGLFRGLAMASAVVVAFFVIILVVKLVKSYGELRELLGTWPGSQSYFFTPSS